ncbi:MAG: iron-only hydrogenase system regulator [Clostridiales bacterium]|nr:iron-only hydrogenase system regulator [Clostridiales bacterium]
MEHTRVALLAIVVENPDAVTRLNDLLHQYSPYIIGRMGLPYPKRNVSLISVMLDAPNDAISALSGKVGKLEGVSTKVVYARLEE